MTEYFYDKEHDILIIKILPDSHYEHSDDQHEDTVLDFNAQGELIGFRIFGAKEKLRLDDEKIGAIAQVLHYPECWDTMAYPTMEDAIWEILPHKTEHLCAHNEKIRV